MSSENLLGMGDQVLFGILSKFSCIVYRVKTEYLDKTLDTNPGALNVVRLDVGLAKYCRGFTLDSVKRFYPKAEWCTRFTLQTKRADCPR